MGAALLNMLLACGIDDARDLGMRGSSIVNGERHEGHPAVGGLQHSLGGSCTATLIGGKTVLTAAHCTHPAAQHYFLLLNQRWAAKRVIAHPRYTSPNVENDFAVVLLREAPGVEPAAIAAFPPEVNQELTLVGLGTTSDEGGGSGVKRVATNAVAELSEMVLTYYGAEGDTGNVCYGDSGGPSFAMINGQEVQVGVHSYIQGACGLQGNDMRVDVGLAWILEQADDVHVGGYPDHQAPELSFISPDLTQPLYPNFELSMEASDDIGLKHVELFVDEVSQGKMTQSQITGVPFSFTLKLDADPTETAADSLRKYSLRAVATDLAGKITEVHEVINIFPYKTFGELCEQASECSTGICQAHSTLSTSTCTQRCRPETPCPEGIACISTGTDYVCAAPAPLGEGGCRLAQSDSPPLGLTPWLLLVLLVSRRRPRVLIQR